MENLQLLPITPASSSGDSASSKVADIVDEKVFDQALSQAQTTVSEKDKDNPRKDAPASKVDRSGKRSPGILSKSKKPAGTDAQVLPTSVESPAPEAKKGFEIRLETKRGGQEISPDTKEGGDNQMIDVSGMIGIPAVAQQVANTDDEAVTGLVPESSGADGDTDAQAEADSQTGNSLPQGAVSEKPSNAANNGRQNIENAGNGHMIPRNQQNIRLADEAPQTSLAQPEKNGPVGAAPIPNPAQGADTTDKNQNHGQVQNQIHSHIHNQAQAAADSTPSEKPNAAASNPQAPRQEVGSMSLDEAGEALALRNANVEVSEDMEPNTGFPSNLQKDIALIRDVRPASLIIESALPEKNSAETKTPAPTDGAASETASETARPPAGESEVKNATEKADVSNQPGTAAVQKDAAPAKISQPAPSAPATEPALPEPDNKGIQAQAPSDRTVPETPKSIVSESGIEAAPETAKITPGEPDLKAALETAKMPVGEPVVKAVPETPKSIVGEPDVKTAPETVKTTPGEPDLKAAPETAKKTVGEPVVKAEPETIKNTANTAGEPDIKAAPETAKSAVSGPEAKDVKDVKVMPEVMPEKTTPGNQPDSADMAGRERQADIRAAITQDQPQKTETADDIKSAWNVKAGENQEFGAKSNTSGDSGFQGQHAPEAKTSFSNTVSTVQSENTFAPASASVSVTTPGQPTTGTTATVPRQFLPPQAPMAQLEGSVRWLLRTDTKGAEIQLHPENLGRVVVSLRVEGAEVHARVWATEASTMPLLENHRAFLESSLKEQGLNLSSFDLQHGKGGQQAKGESQQQHHFAPPMMESWTGNEFRQELPTQLVARHADDGRIELYA